MQNVTMKSIYIKQSRGKVVLFKKIKFSKFMNLGKLRLIHLMFLLKSCNIFLSDIFF